MLSFFLPFMANTYFQALANPAIPTGKKCGWCCEKLLQLINPVLIPRSHGTIYSWCPPRVRNNLGVLEALERQLWTRLYQGLREKHRSTDLHQSLGSSSIDDFECITIDDETEYIVGFSDTVTFSVTDVKTGQRSSY